MEIDSNNIENKLAESIDEFQKRSRKLRIQSNWFLSAVFMALVSGILVFIYASDITESDIGSKSSLGDRISQYNSVIEQYDSTLTSFYREAEKSDKTLRSRLDSVSKQLDVNYNRLDTFFVSHINNNLKSILRIESSFSAIDINPFSSEDGTKIRLGKKDVYFTSYANAASFSKSLESSNSNIDRLQSDYNKMFFEFDSIQDKLPTSFYDPIFRKKRDSVELLRKEAKLTLDLILEKKREYDAGILKQDDDINASYPKLIQINVTRFGSILLILFFVRIIIPQYRYSIKLAAYYDARADALIMFKNGFNQVGLETLLQSLTPEYDFGKSPEMPYEKIIEIMSMMKK